MKLKLKILCVILSKSRSSIKGSVSETTSLDRQVCITFYYLWTSYIYEIVYGWMHVYLAAHSFHSYLCKCFLQLRLSERTRIHKFLTQRKFQVLARVVDSSLPTYLGICFYKLCWIVNVSIFTSFYSQVKNVGLGKEYRK